MPKTKITNDLQLQSIMQDALYGAVEYTMVKLFQENADLIQKYVYDAFDPSYYERTGEFMDAWNYKVKRASDHHNVTGLRARAFGEFYYDPNAMHYNPSKAQHGSPSNDVLDEAREWMYTSNEDVETAWGDAREYLAEILYEGKTGPLFGRGEWYHKKRNAWKPLINKLNRGKIFTWFEEGMSKQGLKVYKR